MRRKTLQQWIDQLPRANQAIAGAALEQRLDAFNQERMAPSERWELLEALRQPIEQLLQDQQARHARGVPTREKTQELAALGQRLRVAVVMGYKRLVQDLHNSWMSGHLLHRRLRVQALHRVTHYLGRILLADSELYLPPTPHVWLELHQTYHYAEAAGLEARPVSNEDPSALEKSSIADQYKLWLLLGLSGPYRLQQGQVTLVYRLLQAWVPKCRLHTVAPGLPEGDAFAIDRNADRPPVYREQLPPGEFSGWYLEVAPMADALQEYLLEMPDAPRLGATRPAEGLEAMLPELLPPLLWSWGVQPARSDARQALGGRVQAVCGLESIHRLLSHGDPGERHGAGRASERHPVPPEVDISPDKYEDWLKSVNVVESIRLQDADHHGPAWAVTQHHKPLDQGRDCVVYDRSPSGYRLGLERQTGSCLRVGELLAVNEATDQRLASVRWIRRDRAGGLEFGAQLLAGAMEPVMIERRRAQGGPRDRWPGLLLGIGSFSHETLITPAFYAEGGSHFELLRDGQRQPIELLHALEITPCFAQFRFAPLY